MHEFTHLVLGHEGSYIDDTGDADCVCDSREKRVDHLASDWLVPRVLYKRFLKERRSRYPLRVVEGFAASIERHPASLSAACIRR